MNAYIEQNKVRAWRQVCYNDSIAISVFRLQGLASGPEVFSATPVQWEKVKDGLGPRVPHIWLNPEEAQQLMDDLYACGIRPTEGAGSAGAMAATERHLKDLQRLVFKT